MGVQPMGVRGSMGGMGMMGLGVRFFEGRFGAFTSVGGDCGDAAVSLRTFARAGRLVRETLFPVS